MTCGFDCGTYNLVCCKRDQNNNFVYKREINSFIELPITNDKFVFNMMKNAGVPLIEWPDAGIAYALGEAAVNIAYTMNQLELKRPMYKGCLNPKEKNAQQIMNIMIHSLIDTATPNEKLYYTIPANAVNEETDADYHSLVLKAMFDSFEDDNGNKVSANPINEALCLIYAELQKKAYTGISVSCGSGMVNICFAIFGAPVFKFSLVNSGDWIDAQTARVTGENIAFINQEKLKLDLLADSDNMVQRALKSQYQIMIQKTVNGIKEGLEKVGSKAKFSDNVDLVVAGGVSLPNGFDKLFFEAIKNTNLPIKIGNVIRPVDPLYSVARGALLAAENSN
jgi:hypothetical protein